MILEIFIARELFFDSTKMVYWSVLVLDVFCVLLNNKTFQTLGIQTISRHVTSLCDVPWQNMLKLYNTLTNKKCALL
jgi:hypothetical protein